MTRFCVNVGFLFTELPFLERFAAVRRAGFGAVEFAWPRVDLDELAAAVRDAGLQVAQLNMDAGDLAAGERGWASHPQAVGRWREAFAIGLELAHALECPAINVLAGNAPAGHARAELEECLEDNLQWALQQPGAAERTLLLEALNEHDTPAYLFNETAPGAAFLQRLGHPRLRLQFDAYHVAMAGEDPLARLRDLRPLVGHVQFADWPGRHEPGSGSIDFRALVRILDETGYGGAVGLEYVPSERTEASLGWLPLSQRAWPEAPR